MRKAIIALVAVLILVFIVGCVDYKSTTGADQPSGDVSNEKSLTEQIAQVEQDVSADSKTAEETKESPEEKTEEVKVEAVPEKTVEQEVVLPKLDDSTDSKDMQVIQVKENEMVRLSVKITDPDQDKINYSFSAPLNNLGQWKTNYGDAGEYVVAITASDGKLTSEKKVKIVVDRVNVAPVISAVSDIHVKEGEKVTFRPVVTDPNNDPVTITISDPLKEGFFQTDYTSAGVYQIKLVASDGEMESERSFTLTVDDVNQLPVITNVADLVVKEGELITLEPKVTDLDDDKVTVTISDPVGDDGIWQTKYVDHGEYFVTVTADDGKGNTTKKIKVTVQDVNMPPEIVDVSMMSN